MLAIEAKLDRRGFQRESHCDFTTAHFGCWPPSYRPNFIAWMISTDFLVIGDRLDPITHPFSRRDDCDHRFSPANGRPKRRRAEFHRWVFQQPINSLG